MLISLPVVEMTRLQMIHARTIPSIGDFYGGKDCSVEEVFYGVFDSSKLPFGISIVLKMFEVGFEYMFDFEDKYKYNFGVCDTYEQVL